MIVLTFNVTGTDLRRTDLNRIVAVSRNNVSAKFSFNSDWDDISPRVVQFYKGEKYYDVSLVNDECTVPWEVLTEAGTLSVTVTGGDLITTTTVDINVYGTGLSSSGLAPTVASPGVYSEVVKLASEINDDYTNMKSIMDTYEDTVNNSMTDISEAAVNAHESEINAAEYASEAKKSEISALSALEDLKNTVINIHNSSEGNVVNVTDTSDKKVDEINIYGKSSQESVPTMTAPVNIVNTFDSLTASVYIANKNMLCTPYAKDNPLTLIADKDDYNKYYSNYPFYIIAGQTYTFSFESDGVAGGTSGTDTVQAGLLDVTNGIHYMTTNNKYLTFTAKKTGKCSFRCDVNKNDCTHSFWNFQVEVGDVNTDYVTGEKQSIDITLTEPLRGVPCKDASYANITIDGQGYISDVICTQNGSIGILKYLDYVKLTSDNFTEYSKQYEGKKIYNKPLSADYKYNIGTAALCSHFRVANINFTVGDMWFPDRRIVVTVDESYDIDSFKAFVDENEMYMVLPLAEPVFTAFDEDIQNEFKVLTTYYGITNVYNSEGAYTKLNYVADTKLYIDNKIEEVAKAIVATESEV